MFSQVLGPAGILDLSRLGRTKVLHYFTRVRRYFARRLLLYEAGGCRRTEDVADAMVRACQVLHVRLTPLLSAAGVNALLGRAIALAAREFPFLAGLGALRAPDCSLDGLREALDADDPSGAADAVVAILGNFLWLLVDFIGENLGLRKVHEASPGVPFTPPEASPYKAPS